MASEMKTLHWEVPKALRFPIAATEILLKRQSLKRELVKQTNLISTRIAILGGSTTAEVKSILELFLLAQGIQPIFYESGYNCYCEDVLFENHGSVEISSPTLSLSTPPGTTCLNSLDCWTLRTKLKTASAMKWPGLKSFGRKYTRNWARSSSRTILTCHA